MRLTPSVPVHSGSAPTRFEYVPAGRRTATERTGGGSR